jgi:hypothetical protein
MTKHMAISIGMFERLDDKALVECFKAEGGKSPTVAEVREHLAELRTQGYKYMPCNCGNYDSEGKCTGVNAKEKSDGR